MSNQKLLSNNLSLVKEETSGGVSSEDGYVLMEANEFELFGFTLKKNNKNTKKQKESRPESFAEPSTDDGSDIFISAGAHQIAYHNVGQYNDQSDITRIKKYREIAAYPECDQAIEEIINEMIQIDDEFPSVELSIDEKNISEKVRKQIEEEFENILGFLSFSTTAYDIARKWYIDGRLLYHIILNEQKTEIVELRPIDPLFIKKVKEVEKSQDIYSRTPIYKTIDEYFIYSEDMDFSNASSAVTSSATKIYPDSIVYVDSGLLDESRKNIISYLHKAIRPLNQLRMLEDAMIVYKLVRAPERRVFRVDVGGLPAKKAEAYMENIIAKFRNKITYNACLAMDTQIPLLDGRTLSLEEISEEWKEGKRLWTYSCDPQTGKFAPGLISFAGVTKKEQPVMKITLDNGKSIICTHDHKFPVWNKGKVEARDLQVGDSMIPFYTQEKIIGKHTTYQQIFENESKKWKFTHRLVSEWKDENELINEMFFEVDVKEKNTVHHKNFDRYNNTPENLCRMNREDHLKYHRSIGTNGGKKGGKVTAQRRKEQGIPQFNISDEQRSEIGKKVGSIVGPRMVKEKKGIHGISREETRQNSLKGNAKLQELLTDKDFKEQFSQNIRDSWTDDAREKARQRMYKRIEENPEFYKNFGKIANNARWNSENSEENRRKSSEKSRIHYPESMIKEINDVVYDFSHLTFTKLIEKINEMIDFSEWELLNKSKRRNDNKTYDRFIYKDLKKISKIQGFSNPSEYKEYIVHKNHKIISIEFLNETADVGTLSIDNDEKYHDYHTFALDAGIYTCNSTGELSDGRQQMAMIEDFWLPTRSGSGSTGTQIDTLPSSGSLADTEELGYFQKKLFRSLNVPLNRLEQEAQFSLGRASEITRDEVKFAKFISRLRSKFSELFYQTLRVQLVLKKIITEEEWDEYKENIFINYLKDNYFTELKDAEIIKDRFGMLREIDEYVGKYVSVDWVRRNVLRQTDADIDDIDKQIEKEKEEMPTQDDGNDQQQSGPPNNRFF